MKEKPVIVLFDQDLRLYDNPALCAAAKSKRPLILAYIFSDEGRKVGSASRFWLHHSLKALQAQCRKRKAHLVLRKGTIRKSIEELIKESGAEALYWNQSFTRAAAYEKLKSVKIACHCCTGNLLMDPSSIQFYKVFTPFWKRCLMLLDPPKPLAIPKWEAGPHLKSDDLTSWKLLDGNASSHLTKYWTPGEEGAREQWENFLEHGLKEYAAVRDRVDLDQTSHLSAHLHFGEISIREIWHTLQSRRGISKETFLKEIGFREFSYHLLHHFPDLPLQNFQSKFDRFKWKTDATLFKKWKEGKTGFPIVDAGMRQLKEMGWMHNRARMITASFLIKDLLIDWRAGEKWFWEHLVDADLALNAFNWQWVAGSGADAAPYFRIFNPQTQSEKFDPEADYAARWIPKGETFKPIVDHNDARIKALAAYKKITV